MRCADIRHWDSALYICRENLLFTGSHRCYTDQPDSDGTGAVVCVPHILKNPTAGYRRKSSGVYILLSFSPLFFGMTMYFNPDYALAVFFIFLLYSYVYDKAVLAAFFRFCAFRRKKQDWCWSADWCLAFYPAYCRKEKPCRKSNFKDVKLYAILAVTLLQLYYTKFIGGIATWTQNGNEEPGLRWDSTGENCLSFQPAFVAVKLKQQFLLNFNWILTAGIVIAVAWWFILKVKGRKKIQASCKICGIAGAFVAFYRFHVCILRHRWQDIM